MCYKCYYNSLFCVCLKMSATMTRVCEVMYQELRMTSVNEPFEWRYYKTLLDVLYTPYSGTLYGTILLALGHELNREGSPMTLEICATLPVLLAFDVAYYADLLATMENHAAAYTWTSNVKTLSKGKIV